jgi:hypothetical protein
MNKMTAKAMSPGTIFVNRSFEVWRKMATPIAGDGVHNTGNKAGTEKQKIVKHVCL